MPCSVAAPTVVLYHAGQEGYFNGLLAIKMLEQKSLIQVQNIGYDRRYEVLKLTSSG
jgi:hypothetical protein